MLGGKPTEAEAKVRDINLHTQRSMVNTGGRGCNEHYDRGIPSEVQEPPRASLGPSPRINHDGSRNSPARNICAELVSEGSDKGNKTENSSSFFSTFHKSKEKRQTTSGHRSVDSQPSSGGPHLQNGDSGGDFQKHHGSFVGLFSRHRGRLLPRPYALGVSQVPRFQVKRENVRLSVPTLRAITCPMGFFKGDQTHKTSPSHPSNLYFQLLGRLSHFLHFSRETEGGLQNSSGTSTELGFQNQLGKIQPRSFSVDRISRCNLESSEARTISSTRQDHAHQRSLHRVQQEECVYQERVGESDRTDELRLGLLTSGETSSPTTSNVDESAHSSFLQGRPCSSGRGFQEASGLLEVSEISESTSPNASAQTIPRPDDGCFSGWMVRDSSTSESNGPMALEREAPFNELERTEGCSTSPSRVSVCVGGEISATSIRQFNNSVLSEETRLGKTCTSTFPDNGDTPILPGLEDQPSSSSSEGCPKRSCRPRVSPSSHCHRVVLGQADFHLVEQPCSPIPSGSIRHKGKHSVDSVCVPLPGPSGSGVQRIQHKVEHLDVHLPHATNELHRGSCESPPELPWQGDLGGPPVALERVVSSSASQMQSVTNPSSPIPLSVSDDFEGFVYTPRCQILETSRMDSLISSLVGKGVDERSIGVIKHAHKPSTLKQYQGTWRKFMTFLDTELIPHNKVDIYVVMNFLAFQHVEKGLKYRTIAAYKSALAHPLYENFKLKLDDSSLEFFMKGVFNLDPPRPAPMAEWSLDSLLGFLVSDQFEPLHSMSFSIVTKKFLCLLLLATGRRIDEIGHLAQRYDFAMEGKSVTIHWLPDYAPKHFNKDFQPHLPSFEGLDSSSCDDLLLCPIRAFRIYLGKFQSNPRGSITRPLWPHSSKVLTNMFIATILQAKHFAGNLANVPIGPHQMRKFAASYSAKMLMLSEIEETKVMERMGCKTMNVLKRHYINHIPNVSFKIVIPAGTFIPALHFGT